MSRTDPAAPRPRIGIDFHTFGGIFQGSRSHILGLYQEAIVLAPDLQFVFLVDDPERLGREHPAFGAANVERVALPHGGGLARLGWQLAAARRRHRIDLLHVQYRLPLVPLGPCACTIHDTLFETHPQFFKPGFVRMSRFTSRLAMRQATLLFTVSEFSRGEMARLYGVDAGRIAITHNAIDARRFHPSDASDVDDAEALRALGLTPGGYICTVGRLEPRKNHVNLLRAYAMLPVDRPPLVVVGQRDFDSEPIDAVVRELGIGPEVRFLENVPDAALPALVRHCRVFAYPSFAEGFGMPVLEAMSSGVPVVTSSTTSLPEVAGDAAIMADPHAPADIARALGLLAFDQPARARAVAAGLAQAGRFSWQASAEVLVASFRAHFSQRFGAPSRPVRCVPGMSRSID
ncbi:MAG TPA: glycosyltransferase family 1 protein [Variovorax sp.]|nr:glycosyltransferase family 1 protein [Variovorax sp.]